MLGPSSENILMSNEMLNIIVKYYKAIYVNYNFWRLFKEGSDNLIIIHVKMSQFERYRISSEIFSLKISSYHMKSLFVLAKFIIKSIVILAKFSFFKHTLDLSNKKSTENFLAYIWWYQLASSSI